MREAEKTYRQGHDDTLPVKLHRYRDAGAYYGILEEPLAQYGTGAGEDSERTELLADIAIALEQIIERHKIRDWTSNPDVKRKMMMEMDDYLYEMTTEHALPFSPGDTRFILDSVLHIAQYRDERN
jgi:type I restriction enzyme R subunit